jgi:predicted enzyme related to lactoylglutathione lyase
MLTNAPILAIVPTTDITRAKTFYGETLGVTDANLSTPGPRCSIDEAAARFSRFTSAPRQVRRSTPLPHGQ